MEMHTDVFVRGARKDTTEALREYARRRLSFAISRFRHRAHHIRFQNSNTRCAFSSTSILRDLTH